MRLSSKEKKTICAVLHHSFGDQAKIWLFGSRLDDSLKGGDVDLYIETPLKTGLLDAKIQAKVALYHALHHTPVDLVVRKLSQPMAGIHKIARSEGISL